MADGMLGVFPGAAGSNNEFFNRCAAVDERFVPRERCLLDAGHMPAVHRDIDGGTWVDDPKSSNAEHSQEESHV